VIGGASQADVGVLVISSRKGEYETGFERGGQTREHAMLAKTQGVNKLIVVVNKMVRARSAFVSIPFPPN
jgi:peptide chain release factor subunit 3